MRSSQQDTYHADLISLVPEPPASDDDDGLDFSPKPPNNRQMILDPDYRPSPEYCVLNDRLRNFAISFGVYFPAFIAFFENFISGCIKNPFIARKQINNYEHWEFAAHCHLAITRDLFFYFCISETEATYQQYFVLSFASL